MYKLFGNRLKLDVDVGKGMDYILIGRDWQEEFELTFTTETIIIKKENPDEIDMIWD